MSLDSFFRSSVVAEGLLRNTVKVCSVKKDVKSRLVGLPDKYRASTALVTVSALPGNLLNFTAPLIDFCATRTGVHLTLDDQPVILVQTSLSRVPSECRPVVTWQLAAWGMVGHDVSSRFPIAQGAFRSMTYPIGANALFWRASCKMRQLNPRLNPRRQWAGRGAGRAI